LHINLVRRHFFGIAQKQHRIDQDRRRQLAPRTHFYQERHPDLFLPKAAWMDARALAHYRAALSDPSRVHAMCEDYRAGAHADFEIDKVDLEAGRKITVPLLTLWGANGVAGASASPVETWKKWATQVSGGPIASGHFLPEENPADTAKALLAFFTEAP